MIFLYSSSGYFCHLFLISSATVRSILFLSFIVPIFAWNVPLCISHFFKEISSLSHYIVCFFSYFFALVTEEGFLMSPCYSLELCIQMGISFLFSFAFLFSSQLLLRPPQTILLPFPFFFSLGDGFDHCSCSMLRISVHSSSCTLSDLTSWISLSLPLYNCKRSDLGHTWMGLVIFPNFFYLSLNFMVRSSLSEPQSAPGFADYIKLLPLCLQRIWSILFWYLPSGDVHV